MISATAGASPATSVTRRSRAIGDASYTDYKVGVTKDVGIGVVGLAYLGTNAKDSCIGDAAVRPRCLLLREQRTAAAPTTSGKTRLVLTFGKTF